MKKRISKFFALILSVLLIAAAMPAVAFAADFTGEGTPQNPFVIDSFAALKQLSDEVAAKNSFAGVSFVMTADITAEQGFAPIGSKEAPFSGVFNGGGHFVSSVSVNGEYAGLFGYTVGAELSDIGVRNSTFSSSGSYAGAIVAYAEATAVKNCSVGALVNVYGYNYVGGIAGYMKTGVILGCSLSSRASISGYTEYCGGIAGYAGGLIKDCSTGAEISGYAYTGGIAGASTAVIADCVNTGSIKGSTAVGGVAGEASGSILRCANSGDITQAYGDIGGVAGSGKGCTVSESYNAGSVSAGGDFCGGIIGSAENAVVSSCYNRGAISTQAFVCGGIFGKAENTAVSYCYNAAVITGTDTAGIGAKLNGTAASCYYLEGSPAFISQNGSVTGCSALSSEALGVQDSFTGFDFNSVWEINGLHSYSYPVLKNNLKYHTLSFIRTVAPSCTLGGYSQYLCTGCQNSYELEKLPATGHSFSVTESKPASCTENGFTEYKCDNCSESKREDFTATGHKDADNNNYCDVCNTVIDPSKVEEEKSFFEKIANFFNRIFAWIKNLFA